MMEQYQIFISYRRNGGDGVAGRIADRLRSLGYTVFLDVQDMQAGKFDEQIKDVIEQCRDVLLILSPHALDRCVQENDWIRQEIVYALRQRKNIIPIILDGFDSSVSLPQEIGEVLMFEGVPCSHVYFDAMIERVRNLLHSAVNVSSKYALETQEFYKVQTPLFNMYKRSDNTPRGYLNIAVLLEKLNSEMGAAFRWRVPEVPNHTLRSLRGFFECTKRETVLEWYDGNRARLSGLREMSLTMKDEPDQYFYAQAIAFAMGCMYKLPSFIFRTYPSAIVQAFCYCLDFPRERFGELERSFRDGDHGLREFDKNLPLAFDVWPDMSKTVRYNSERERRFDSYGCLLFDFMIELTMLILDTCKDSQLDLMLSGQLRSYYKWLRRNKLYLPRWMQEKLHRYI